MGGAGDGARNLCSIAPWRGMSESRPRSGGFLYEDRWRPGYAGSQPCSAALVPYSAPRMSQNSSVAIHESAPTGVPVETV